VYRVRVVHPYMSGRRNIKGEEIEGECMKTLDYDVVVIGAGPAGSQAARFAAKGGARTLLMEKRQEIGSPVRCGEGISKEWLPAVEIPYDKKYVAHEVDGAVIISPGGYRVCIDAKYAGNEVGCIIERDMFDKYLATLQRGRGRIFW
jgi:digeranylgeranylglycerophospholipid reductase